MNSKRVLIHSAFVLALPVIVAWLGLSVLGAVALVILALAWRWLLSLSVFVLPDTTPELQLDTIGASHFVEKVRWCMDRLGLDYVENQSGGTLGAWFLGRTVPRLRMRTGAVHSSIGNSTEILRYLWGSYSESATSASFLRPTEKRVELEQKLDRYGRNLQVWVYYHLRADKGLTIHAWGGDSPLVPAWQRSLLRALYPLLAFLIRKSFRITPGNYQRAVERIETLLAETDAALADGRRSILGDEDPNYTDFAFAAMCGLWLMPAAYGGGKADAVRIEHGAAPRPMRADIERWKADYPRAVAYVETLYANERAREN